ncbi:GIY-YIG nuclease family protein [Lysinibacillus sp. FSL H8-0500]|uniref:GIY-YIG nuclease family protein n=1 Tax=Lysinibacillus sp. FSL H8-0500 TaxID=2921393 RepID=UPI003100E324
MSEILLNDLLKFDDNSIANVKIKFNQRDGHNDPMELYKENPDVINNQWLFWRNKTRYFSVGQIAICFLKLSPDTWLLTTIKKVTNELNRLEGINYEGEELPQYSQYYGRIIVKFHKTFMTQGRYFKDIHYQLVVQQILPSIFEGDDFPGYDKVKLSYQQLHTIITRGKRDWVAALENQKAVYVITDKFNGKLYIGSATSNRGMLLDRWSSYVQNGHGGNHALKQLVEDKGIDYVKQHFQYAILENYNAKIDDKIILQREAYWKEVLQSRAFGYNRN